MKSTTKSTIYDIARKAGASASTVSSALNGSWKARRISSETVERIKKIANEEGYSVNLQARGLRKAKSGLTGMILPEHKNRFFSTVSQAFAVEARNRGQCPAIVLTGRDPDEQAKSISSLISYAVDSLMIVGASEPESLSRLCAEAGVQHVFVDQPARSAPSIVSDNAWGAGELASSLLDHMPPIDKNDPRTFLYFVGGDGSLYATSLRIDGFRQALHDRGALVGDDQVIACGYDPDATRIELEKLYARLGQLPAGLLINSIRAFEGGLRFLGTLPEAEISCCRIGCYDYDPLGMLLRFPIHMVRQRADELVAEAYRHLDAGDATPCLKLIKPELIAS